MRPTLRSILASATLRSGLPEVLSGSERLDAPVRWVHVSEVREVSGLLQGGELILTTGLAMRGSAEEAVGYLEAVVDAGAAGLVVELGEAFPEVPPAVVARARALGFPLVSLRSRVRFVEVTEEVHRSIVAEQLEQVELAREVHETFTRLSLESADAAAIVTTTAALCDSSVVLEDLNRHVVAFAPRGRPASGLLADWERRSRATPVLEATGLTGPEGWMTASVGRRGDRWARLVVPDTRVAQSRLAMVLERAAQALELGRMVERDRVGLALQAQGGLLADLASGRLTDEETARARAVSLGLARAPRYVAVVVRPTAGPGRAAAQTIDDVAQHDRSRELVATVSSAVAAAGLSGLVGAVPDPGAGPVGPRVGVLLAVPRGGRGRQPDETSVLEGLAAGLLPHGVVLGVGPASADLVGAGGGLRLASHVADVAAAMPADQRHRPYHRSSDVRIYGLVALLHDDPRVQGFVESELSAILGHASGEALLSLLREYVEAGGNKTRMARQSHRSRTAVYKQLDRLERVLGVDLDDPVSLMSLGLAVMAYDHGRQAPGP